MTTCTTATTSRSWVVDVQPQGAEWPDVQVQGEVMRPQHLVVTVEQEGDGLLGVGAARAMGPKVCPSGQVSGFAALRTAWPGAAEFAAAPTWVTAAAQAALDSIAGEALVPGVWAAGAVGYQAERSA
jgi:hypothetical protein